MSIVRNIIPGLCLLDRIEFDIFRRKIPQNPQKISKNLRFRVSKFAYIKNLYYLCTRFRKHLFNPLPPPKHSKLEAKARWKQCGIYVS